MTLSQHANSLPEPVHEFTDVSGFLDGVLLYSFTMNFTMNEGSFIADSSTGLYKYAVTMIVSFIEVACVFCSIAVVQFALTVPLAIPEASFIAAYESVIYLTLAIMLVRELDRLFSMAIVSTLVETSNVHGGAII